MRATHFVTVILAAAASTVAAQPQPHRLRVWSDAFKANAPIPEEYTCNGTEESPPLAWDRVPGDTRTLALLVDDPDANGGKQPFVHWMITNIPSTSGGVLAGESVPAGAMAGRNDKGTNGYTGPCPPSGKHHYHFRVFALDTAVARPNTRAEFFAAIRGHVLAEGELVATYEK